MNFLCSLVLVNLLVTASFAFCAPQLSSLRRFRVRTGLITVADGAQNILPRPPLAGVRSKEGQPEKANAATPAATTTKPEPPSKPIRSFMRSALALVTSTEHFFSMLLAVAIEDEDLLSLTAKASSYAFWTFVTLCFLGTIGIDTKPVLSLLSVAGITLGFAGKDIIANTLSGLFIVLTKPFERGSIIVVNGHRGRVLSVDLRYVRLQSLTDESEIVMPVSSVCSSPIVVESQPSK